MEVRAGDQVRDLPARTRLHEPLCTVPTPVHRACARTCRHLTVLLMVWCCAAGCATLWCALADCATDSVGVPPSGRVCERGSVKGQQENLHPL